MSHVIRISKATYRRLQQLAVPFIDTPADVIDRLITEHEQQSGNGKASQPALASADAVELDPLNPKSLSHTRVLFVKVAGKSVRPKWNSLVVAANQVALKKLGSISKLRQVTLSNIAEEERSDSGFRYIQGAGFSIQYCDSNHAWQNSLHLAQRLGFELEVLFEWMNKPDALHPGKQGKLHWTPGA